MIRNDEGLIDIEHYAPEFDVASRLIMYNKTKIF